MNMTTELAQIKRDIAARKAMPDFGPLTSIERLRIINTTQKSFSLETVETLVEALEARDKQISQQREYYEGVIADGSQRIAELEARTVKLPEEFYPDGDIDCPLAVNLDDVKEMLQGIEGE